MINPSPLRLETEPWQRELADAVGDPSELLRLLELVPDQLPGVRLDRADFPLRVPRHYVGLMRRGDPADPLLAQVLPREIEQRTTAGYLADPVGDLAASRDHGVLHKYNGRALLVTTGACAVHCRYCFRRHFPYAELSALGQWQQALETLQGMPDVREVILSGGDPLSLSDSRLEQLVDGLRAVPHLRRLRVHTRLPVVLPNRVTERLVATLAGTRLTPVCVIHANHPNEISPELGDAMRRLKEAGVTLLNQSVFLKFINDDADTLVNLSESLFGIGVLPYYLHLLDPVAGAAHFDVPQAHVAPIYRELRARLPGYLVPRIVRETAGEPFKVPI